LNILIIHEIDWEEKVIFEPHHLAELFSIQGHEIFVIDCAQPNSKDLIKGMQTRILLNYSRVYDNANITLIRPASFLVKGVNRMIHYFSCKKVIQKTIQDRKIDKIFLYGSITNGIQTIKIAQEKKIPVIYRVLDISHELINILGIKQIAKKLESKVISNSNLVLTTTNDLSRYAIEMGAKKNNVEVFPLGVNFQDFKPMKKSLELQKELDIKENDKVIIFVGTLYTFAGLENIINNFSLFEKNVKFIIIGGGPNFNRIKLNIKSKKLEESIILLGFIPQNIIAKYIALADICINPFEINSITNLILPTKILEYLACKKPVLSTPLEGTKKILLNDKYGIIYSNQNDFVKKLSNLLKDELRLEEISGNGYQYVIKNHDWKKLSNQLITKIENAAYSEKSL
jgi:glycosyltransferase involved in cell wall biosynthesis